MMESLFFFQAEDGIRDLTVTGVQTCALPICFYNSTTDLIQTRQQIRQAAGMLPSDLRGISSVGSDISAMSDSAIEFRSGFGTSVVCSNIGGALPTVPRVLAPHPPMTSWAQTPAAGD